MRNENSTIIKHLNEFIQEPDFLKLNDLLQSKFNLFQLLDIENKEIYFFQTFYLRSYTINLHSHIYRKKP